MKVPRIVNLQISCLARAKGVSLRPTSSICHYRFKSSKASISSLTSEDIKEFREKEKFIKKELRDEAAFLSKSLYRLCLRSVRLIRHGNEFDRQEFEQREKQRLEEENSPQKSENIRMGTFSMVPPVDPEDELRSRAEYYHQFARENLFQESDCLSSLDEHETNPLHEQDVDRFLFLLKKGDHDRNWLLQDMMFPDPYKQRFNTDLAKAFEEKALTYIQESQRVQRAIIGEDDASFGYEVEKDDEGGGNDDDEFFDDDGEQVPDWMSDKYSHHLPRGPKK